MNGNRFDHYGVLGEAAATPPREAWRNAPRSGADLLETLAYPFIHPIDTLRNLGNLAVGTASALTPAPSWWRGPQQDKADAAAGFNKNRYGSLEGLKNTLATDPLGVAADAAGIFNGGAALGARVPGVVGQVARVAGSIPGRLVSRVGEPIVSNTLGVVTRKGADAVRAAGRAGVEANDMLPAHMSGLARIEDVQGMATSALDKARQEALAAYSNDAASAAADRRPFDFQTIEAALPDRATARTSDGIDLTDIPRLRAKLDEIIGKVKASDPAAQTPQRRDELKRAVAALGAWNLPRSPERAAVDRVHAAIEAEIADTAPNYIKAMADHWKAADQLDGVSDSLRVQNDDAAIRKLQAMSRINVATSDGRRATLMDILARHEPALPYALAGQAMKGSESSGVPARLLGLSHPALQFLAVPRLVGEAPMEAGR